MNGILAGMALEPIENQSLLITNTSRVLKVDAFNDLIVVIETSPRESAHRKYFTAPFLRHLSHIEKEIQANAIALHPHGIKARPDVRASDEELNAKYKSNLCKSVQCRHARFSTIRSLVPLPQDYPLTYDKQTRNELVDKFLQQPANKDFSKPEVEQTIFQFLAGGSTPNALTPFLSLRGGRGKERQQKEKIGRPNAPTKAGQVGYEGFVMAEEDKELCGYAFKHYLLKGKTVGKAYRRMLTNYYSELVTKENGKTEKLVYPSHECPSQAQFERWGEKYSNQSVWQKQFNPQQLARLDRELLKKQNDEILMVGQLGAIDSTSVDTEFVSVDNCLERIGPAHRMLVADGVWGYIPGFYMGIDAPSHTTVGLAFLNAASDKTDWIEEYGLSDEMTAEDWIPIQFGQFNADNTDLRNSQTMSKLESLGIGITFVPVCRSDFNSRVEVAHKALHRLVDHNMPGTTLGKQRVRGDERPDVFARMTIKEGIRESARAVHFYNTVPLDIPLTLEIRRELVDKGLTLNRLNLTKMTMNSGRVHSTIHDFDELMCKFGVPITGTFTAEGVKLHRTDQVKREFIDRIRYISTEPEMLKRFKEAKTNRRGSYLNYDATFFHNPYSPSKIYYPDPHTGIIYKLKIVSEEAEIDEFTMPDFLASMNHDAQYQYHANSVKQQKRAALEEKQQQSIKVTEDKYKAALAASPPISKSSMTKNKKANRLREKTISINGVPEANLAEESKTDIPAHTQDEPSRQSKDTSFLDNLILRDRS